MWNEYVKNKEEEMVMNMLRIRIKKKVMNILRMNKGKVRNE